MNGIYHKVGILAKPNIVYKALTSQSGLTGWWTSTVDGTFSKDGAKIGETIQFGFGLPTGMFWMEMKVQETKDSERVIWECTAGPDEWIASHIEFNLRPTESGNMTLLFFQHRDWKTENEFMAHCSMKWALFLFSLKELLETGKGKPAPNDLKIDEIN